MWPWLSRMIAPLTRPPDADADAPPQGDAGRMTDADVEANQPEQVDALAAGLSDQENVWWAARSSREVADKQSPQSLAATEAAEWWVRDPTPENRIKAGQAAQAAGHREPGAWAAQAAAWSQPDAAAAPGPDRSTASLTAVATAGSVKLAAALAGGAELPAPADLPGTPDGPETLDVPHDPEPPEQPEPTPEQKQEHAEALKPFLDLGKQIQAGENTWAG